MTMTRSGEEALNARFGEVAQTIGARLSRVSPRVVALVAKWAKEDLVPGLSDMDFRVICDENATADDWAHIDRQLGHIHREMVAEHPEWNRINEHTPGAGVSLRELSSERLHHPEYAVWTVWWGRGDWAKRLRQRTRSRPLDAFDEHYHLARFLAYYSPYIHGIDPPINLAEFEAKYALHSRCWHYFAPPMLSAATLLARRHFSGKREALIWLGQNSFAASQIDAVLEQVDAHYETPEQRDSERLGRFEHHLFTAFEQLLKPICEAVQTMRLPADTSPPELKQYLATHPTDPLINLLDHVRYARIRAGRYYFYLNAPLHFSAEHQLIAEHCWTRKLHSAIFGSLRALRNLNDVAAAACLENCGVQLAARELHALRSMEQLVQLDVADGRFRHEYGKAVEWYPSFYRPAERANQKLIADELAALDQQVKQRQLSDGGVTAAASL